MKKYQQGDVILKTIDELPENVKFVKEAVLIPSDHPHVVEGDFKVGVGVNDDKYLVVNSQATIIHQKVSGHAPIDLEQGTYKVYRVVEKNMFSGLVAPVAD